MKYIVIQGRMPQNGDTAKTARITFPDWISPTLVCAGIIGRVQELTDGGILEGGKVEEYTPGELMDAYQALQEDYAAAQKIIEGFDGWLPPGEPAQAAPEQLNLTTVINNPPAVQHDPLRLQEFGTLAEAQAAHDALADKYDEMHEMLIQRTTQRDALYATALNNLNTLRDK